MTELGDWTGGGGGGDDVGGCGWAGQADRPLVMHVHAACIPPTADFGICYLVTVSA